MYPSYQIENKVFIFENTIDSKIIDKILELTKIQIEKSDYKIRINAITNSGKISFNKNINQLNDSEKNIYKDLLLNSNVLLHENYIDVENNNELREIIDPIIFNYINFLYKENNINIRPKEGNVLFYKHEHSMKIHRDGGGLDNLRVCTSTLYLNEKFENAEGGDVIFYNDEKEIIYKYTPKKGDIIIFDSFNNQSENSILHSVTKVKNWDRYVYRTYWQK